MVNLGTQCFADLQSYSCMVCIDHRCNWLSDPTKNNLILYHSENRRNCRHQTIERKAHVARDLGANTELDDKTRQSTLIGPYYIRKCDYNYGMGRVSR